MSTLLSSIFDIGSQPQTTRNKAIYLNKREKQIKRHLANHLKIDSFRGYYYYFSYQHGNDVHECDTVNEFIKSITNNECYTKETYTVTVHTMHGNLADYKYVKVCDLLSA